jgi:hypothetical protein
MFRAIATSYAVGKVFKSKEALNILETGAGRTDPQYIQRGLSKDGRAFVVKKLTPLRRQYSTGRSTHHHIGGFSSAVRTWAHLPRHGNRP